MTTDQLNMDDDLDSLIERGDEDEERGTGYRDRPWWYLKSEGDVAVLRFLEESKDWRKVLTHRFYPTKPEPEGHEGKWPNIMNAVCRGGRLSGRFPQGCAICTSGWLGKFKKGSKAEDVRYTLAVEREQYEEGGRRLYRDKEVEVPAFDMETGELIEGQTLTLPSIVMVAEDMWHMMSALKGVGEALGSLCTQDIRLKRIKNPSGSGQIITPVAVGENGVVPGSEHWEAYQLAMQLWKPGGLVLNREILYRAGDEYWNHFFLMDDGRTWKQHDIERGGDPTSHNPQPGSSSGGSSGGGTPAASSTVQPDADKLAAMRARISSGAK